MSVAFCGTHCCFLEDIKLRVQCLHKPKDNLNYPLYIKLKGIAVAMPFFSEYVADNSMK